MLVLDAQLGADLGLADLSKNIVRGVCHRDHLVVYRTYGPVRKPRPRGYPPRMTETPERDPAQPTPDELEETAASEGLMATEEETDPEYVEDPD